MHFTYGCSSLNLQQSLTTPNNVASKNLQFWNILRLTIYLAEWKQQNDVDGRYLQ